jgi:hypothetical protein
MARTTRHIVVKAILSSRGHCQPPAPCILASPRTPHTQGQERPG